MSSNKKVSAFSVFKGKKATSLTNINGTDNKVKNGESTPNGLNSVNGKVGSDRKKPKPDMKKLKKLLKQKGRPSYLPDDAVLSPMATVKAIKSSVELRSLRPKNSISNINYQLPLRATPDAAKPPLPSSKSEAAERKRQPPPPLRLPDATPPLPPKTGSRKGAQSVPPPLPQRRSVSPPPSLPPRKQRDSPPDENKPRPRKVTRSASLKSTLTDVIAARPLKRRRLSEPRAASDVTEDLSAPESAALDGDASKTSQVTIDDTEDLVQPASLAASTGGPSVSLPNGRARSEPMPSHPADVTPDKPYMWDSRVEATKLFECLIHPVKPQKFFSELWEKKPLLVKRHNPTYNDGWMTTAEMDRILRQEHLDFGVNLDVTTYVDGKRETHNPPGRAYAPVVWDFYQNGCSVRMLNPQTYSRPVWKLLSILQEYFGSCAGANMYLTPPGTQGFAPHYDDIEAFILQLEGKKHWRLYSPRSEAEALPRYSSNNFTDGDVGDPILDVILEAGDLLYFPRGTIHQGRTLEDAHSLHITFSCCQKNTWGDLLEKLVPQALQAAIEEDIEFRQALPIDYLGYMGVAYSEAESPERKNFLRRLEGLMSKLIAHASVDAAVDQMGKQFIHDSLPPVLTEDEKSRSIHGTGERWDAAQGRVRGAVEVEPDTKVKIIRKGILRLVSEGDNVCIYHSLENARLYHGKDLQMIEITADAASAVEQLIHAYPNYIAVEELASETLEERLELASLLYDKGLIMTEGPLEPHYSDDSDED